MNRRTPDDLRSYATYTLKTFQDLLKDSADNDDNVTFETVLSEMFSLFKSFLREDWAQKARIAKLYLDRLPASLDQTEARASFEFASERAEIAGAFLLARDQILFRLTGRVLSQALVVPHKQDKVHQFNLLAGHLPSKFERLAVVYDSVNGRGVRDYWGWDWWDLIADGQARFVDTFSEDNRLFCVAGLRILARVPVERRDQINFRLGENSEFRLNEAGGQSLAASARDIGADNNDWEGILTNDERALVGDLLKLLDRAKASQEMERDNRLIAAQLEPAKVEEFCATILKTLLKMRKLRPLLVACGRFRDRTQEAAAPTAPTLGYNRIDDKGAFISDWHVSYPDWGEGYGRGLALSEDNSCFSLMKEAVPVSGEIFREELIEKVAEQLRARKMATPIVVCPGAHMLKYEEGVRSREMFIARYESGFPDTIVTRLEGCAGVLSVDGALVPVFDVYVDSPESNDDVLLFDGASFATWEQLAAGNADDQEHVKDGVYVRVIDLNADDATRETILRANPKWLQDKPDKERYLRMHAVVNVHERFRISMESTDAAARFVVVDPDHDDSPPDEGHDSSDTDPLGEGPGA